MLAADRPLAFAESGNDHPVHIQIIQAYGSRHNIHDRIHCPHFVKMYLFRRNAVSFRFCIRQDPEYFYRGFLCARGDIRLFNDRKDLGDPPVFMGRMAVAFMGMLCPGNNMAFQDLPVLSMYMFPMRMSCLVGMAFFIFMFFTMAMTFSMCMAVSMTVTFSVFAVMSMAVTFSMRMVLSMGAAMEIFHIVIMILMAGIQFYSKITGVQT